MSMPTRPSTERSLEQPRPTRPARGRRGGYTLIELLIVMTVLGILASIALPSMRGIRNKAQIASAVAEIASLQQEINEFYLLNDRYPNNLSEIGRATDTDAWGRSYQYLNHDGASDAQKRKDRFLVIVNNDYDLYSTGVDGLTVPEFNTPTGRDDVVRALNSGYVGLAEAF